MFKLALRNLLRQKVRNLITLASIVFGVAALVIAGGFVEDVFIQLRDATIKSRLGYLQVSKTGYFEFGRRDPYAYLIDEPDKLTERFRKVPGVEDVLQRVNITGLINNGKTDRAIAIEGIEAEKESELSSFMSVVQGRDLTSEDATGIMLGEGVAAALALAPGDYVSLLGSTTSGAMNSLELEVVGVFRSFSKEFDARTVRIPLTTAQELIDSSAVHTFVFSLIDAEAVPAVERFIEQRLTSGKLELKTWLELDDFYPKTVDLYKSQFGVLQLIILMIVLLSVANSVSMTANERVGEFGTLRALGHTSRYVYSLILLENGMLGLVGATLGTLIGIALAVGISQVGIPMPPPPNANAGYTAYIRVVPLVCVAAFSIGFAATVVSALLTCLAPTRRPITDALRQNI